MMRTLGFFKNKTIKYIYLQLCGFICQSLENMKKKLYAKIVVISGVIVLQIERLIKIICALVA